MPSSLSGRSWSLTFTGSPARGPGRGHGARCPRALGGDCSERPGVASRPAARPAGFRAGAGGLGRGGPGGRSTRAPGSAVPASAHVRAGAVEPGGRTAAGRARRQRAVRPAALLLAVAAALALMAGTAVLAVAIVAVIVLNAVSRSCRRCRRSARWRRWPPICRRWPRVLRDGLRTEVEARTLVPGDVLLIEEGARICADGRLIEGDIEVDLSALTGESMPASRSAELADASGPLLDARDLVFSGTTCTGGEARALVTATGMATELGRLLRRSEELGTVGRFRCHQTDLSGRPAPATGRSRARVIPGSVLLSPARRGQ